MVLELAESIFVTTETARYERRRDDRTESLPAAFTMPRDILTRAREGDIYAIRAYALYFAGAGIYSEDGLFGRVYLAGLCFARAGDYIVRFFSRRCVKLVFAAGTALRTEKRSAFIHIIYKDYYAAAHRPIRKRGICRA